MTLYDRIVANDIDAVAFLVKRKCHGKHVTYAVDTLNFMSACYFSHRIIFSRWSIPLERNELREVDQILEEITESDSGNFEIAKITKRPPFVHVETICRERKFVGMRLIKLLKRDIHYEHNCDHCDTPGAVETLFWNDGGPDFERIRRRGITKNWRTGEDL